MITITIPFRYIVFIDEAITDHLDDMDFTPHENMTAKERRTLYAALDKGDFLVSDLQDLEFGELIDDAKMYNEWFPVDQQTYKHYYHQ